MAKKTKPRAWLDSLKVGDEVTENLNNFILTVTARNEHDIITGMLETREAWSATTGLRRGVLGALQKIIPVTEAHRKHRERTELAYRCRCYGGEAWHALPLKKLRQIVALLDAPDKRDVRSD